LCHRSRIKSHCRVKEFVILDGLVKVLKSFFKGPVPTRAKKAKAKVVRSSSHTRYSSPAKTVKRTKTVVKKSKPPQKASTERRSAKSYIKKTPEKTPVKKPVSEKPPKPLKEKKPKDPAKAAKAKKPVQEFYVGEITHYFAKISVVVVKVEEHPILIADTIIVKGSKEFSQKVQSLQVESKDVRFARKGELVGLQVIEPAKPGDKVYKIKK
jgi:hypothetical protein